MSFVSPSIDFELTINCICNPRAVREGFACMAKQLPVKYPQVNAHDFIGSVIFFRFFCPAIIKPTQYGIIDEGK
jgi:hypothetical protein